MEISEIILLLAGLGFSIYMAVAIFVGCIVWTLAIILSVIAHFCCEDY